MPLHIICQCCKCKQTKTESVWAISRDHKYSQSRYVCEHFDVEIDTVSRIGMFGFGWRNEITIRATYKSYSETRTVLNKLFNTKDMEHESYECFSNRAVFHARVSDSRGMYPSCGFNLQNEIEYEEHKEKQRLEELRRLQKEREEKQRQYERELNKIIDNDKKDEIERKKDLLILEKKCNRKIKTTNLKLKRKQKEIKRLNLEHEHNFDVIFSKNSNFSSLSTEEE